MVFAGDIALPSRDALHLVGVPAELAAAGWYANLEGSLVESGDAARRACVFNHVDALRAVRREVNLRGVSLANNHVFDAAPLAQTEQRLATLGIAGNGAGANLAAASRPLLLDDAGCTVMVLSFGWRVIRCKTAGRQSEGVNPLTTNHVLETFDRYSSQFTSARKVVYFHWGYELDNAPQPAHRDLAFRLVEMGADAVIGAHAHLVQGGELYRGKPILYGLGNFLFAQGVFHGGVVRHPAGTDLGIVFETDLAGTHRIHTLRQDREQGTVVHRGAEAFSECRLLLDRTPYAGASSLEYARWFERNRTKRRGLPVYYSTDHPGMTALKDSVVWTRDLAIRAMRVLRLR